MAPEILINGLPVNIGFKEGAKRISTVHGPMKLKWNKGIDTSLISVTVDVSEAPALIEDDIVRREISVGEDGRGSLEAGGNTWGFDLERRNTGVRIEEGAGLGPYETSY